MTVRNNKTLHNETLSQQSQQQQQKKTRIGKKTILLRNEGQIPRKLTSYNM